MEMKLGIIGLDSSHVSAFTHLLNDANDPFHLEGARVVWAYPGVPSMDFDFSYHRLDGYTKELQEQFGVEMLDSEEAVAEAADAILLEQVDSRKRVEQFSRIVSYGKPVFVDKAFALNSGDAARMIGLARQYRVPLMSCSALRCCQGLNEALEDNSLGGITGADFFGPMPIQPTQNLFFWYGVHTADMLLRTMGRGCESVQVVHTGHCDQITALWADGRIGSIRGIRGGANCFGGVIHRERGAWYLNSDRDEVPYYASLLAVILSMFRTGIQPYSNEELMDVMRFLEAANQSLKDGKMVRL